MLAYCKFFGRLYHIALQPKLSPTTLMDLSYNDVKCGRIHVTLNLIGLTLIQSNFESAFDVVIRSKGPFHYYPRNSYTNNTNSNYKPNWKKTLTLKVIPNF